MMKAIVFDVDDTVYDQQEIFAKACRDAFGELREIPVTDLFKASRYYSDECFEAVERGEMTKEEMYIYRIKRTVEHFGQTITDEQANKYQERYVYYGSNMEVTEGMKKILAYCSEHMKTGVITNGPSAHQWRKIKTLNLEQWVKKENIFVSGDVGANKPDKEIFEYAVKKMQLSEDDDIVYVGDSYEKDILGATNAGWKAIWLDRRGREVPDDFPEHAELVRSEEELFQLIRKMA